MSAKPGETDACCITAIFNTVLMATDSWSQWGQHLTMGNNFHLSIRAESEDQGHACSMRLLKAELFSGMPLDAKLSGVLILVC